jgi:hypothetical protein
MNENSELRDFMLKFYQNLLCGMLKSRMATDDRLSSSYMDLSDKEKKDLDIELSERSEEMAELVVNELSAQSLLIETEPTLGQSEQINKIVRKVLEKFSGEQNDN